MISRNSVAEKKTYLNHQTVYPLIKGGGFGTLERQCQITKDGLYEKQGRQNQIGFGAQIRGEDPQMLDRGGMEGIKLGAAV